MSNSCDTCQSETCSTKNKTADETDNQFKERQKLESRLCRIKKKIVVLSGKGGVGKSTVSMNLAVSLSITGHTVGLLDVDIHGPSIPTMIRFKDTEIQGTDDGITPLQMGNLKVMSIGYLLRHEDDPVIWRGPRKMGAIRQLIADVNWGDLDYLIIDSPPGTGDEPLSVMELIKDIDGAVVVTTPQEVAGADVRKSLNFCKQLSIPVIGIVENMSGFVCPKCNEVTAIFGQGGGVKLAEQFDVPFLGSIPIDPRIGIACDDGKPFIYHYSKTETAKIFKEIIDKIEETTEKEIVS